MIYPICNQPINFCEPLTLGCKDDPVPLYIAPNDRIIFQFTKEPCEGAEDLMGDLGKGWEAGTGWTINAATGFCGLPGSGGGLSTYGDWNPTVGQGYFVQVEVAGITGGITIHVGGVDHTVYEDGVHLWYVAASNTDAPVVQLVEDASSGCFTAFHIYEANMDLTVRLISCEDGSELHAVNIGDHPQFFSIAGTNVTVDIPMSGVGDISGCFQIEVVDVCGYDEYKLESITSLTVWNDSCPETYKVRVCNDRDHLGFVAGYFEARLKLTVARPRFPIEVNDLHQSDGVKRRTMAERTTTLDLNIEKVDVALHPFLSAMALFDHFYVHDREYLIEGGEYSPEYADSATGNAPVTLQITPKEELMKRVACDEEGEGCAPEDDPICNTPDRMRVREIESGGNAYLQVELPSVLGFIPGEIQWTMGGVAQTPVPYVPGTFVYNIGPVLPASIVVITVTDANDAECNYVHDPVTIDTPEEDYFMFTVLENGGLAASLVVGSDSGYWALAYDDGTVEIYESYLDLNLTIVGNYTVYACDVNGNAVTGGQITEIFFSNLAVFPVDFTALPGLLAIDIVDGQMTIAPVLTASTALISMNYQDNDLQVHPDVSIHPVLEVLNLPNNALLDSDQAFADMNALNHTPVIITPGTVETSGGTNAAVTSASATDRSDLISRGYTVNFNS